MGPVFFDDQLVVEVDDRGTVLVIGEVDASNESTLAMALRLASAGLRGHGVRVDLSNATFVSVGALRILVDAEVSATAQGRRLTICEPSSTASKVLRVLRDHSMAS